MKAGRYKQVNIFLLLNVLSLYSCVDKDISSSYLIMNNSSYDLTVKPWGISNSDSLKIESKLIHSFNENGLRVTNASPFELLLDTDVEVQIIFNDSIITIHNYTQPAINSIIPESSWNEKRISEYSFLYTYIITDEDVP